jgi:hypothetical protein
MSSASSNAVSMMHLREGARVFQLSHALDPVLTRQVYIHQTTWGLTRRQLPQGRLALPCALTQRNRGVVT